MSHDYERLKSRVVAVLASIQPWLTDGEAGEVRLFIDAGEYGVAFETLCAILKEERKSISSTAASSLAELGRQMGFDDSHWIDVEIDNR